jgi:hypothetical protein
MSVASRRANERLILVEQVDKAALEMYREYRLMRDRLNVPFGTDSDALADIRKVITHRLNVIHRDAGVDDLHGEPL